MHVLTLIAMNSDGPSRWTWWYILNPHSAFAAAAISMAISLVWLLALVLRRKKGERLKLTPSFWCFWATTVSLLLLAALSLWSAR